MRWLVCALTVLLVATPAASAIRKITLQPPARDFGYFLGDVLTAVAVISTDRGTVLDRAALPEPGPVSRQIDIRRVVVAERDDAAGREIRIRIEYQSFYGPDTATQTEVPGYKLEFSDGRQHFTADVPAWRFTASALRHAVVAVTDTKAIRADHVPAPLQNGTAALRLVGGLAATLLAGSIYILRRGLVPGSRTHRLPFTGAARRLPALLRAAPPANGQSEAFLELHRAFNATAGQALLAGDIDLFLDEHPRFALLRPEIARFFHLSQQRFFGNDSGMSPDMAPWLLAFTRRLRQAERG